MAQFTVDAKGNRIKTDILVSGYVRENAKQYELSIPVDINKICFLFWFIQVCDKWDKQYLTEYIGIDDEQTIRTIKARLVTVYGCRSVDKGSYSWEIKLTRTGLYWFATSLTHSRLRLLLLLFWVAGRH